MSLLSRFRKQKEDEAPEELDETLASSEEEGLLMSTGAEQASPGEEPKPAAGASEDNGATNQAEIDDLLEAAESDTSSTVGEAVTESSDETAASQVEVDDLLEAAQDEPAAAGGADVAPEGENAAASQPAVDDLLEVAQDEPAAAPGADVAPGGEDAPASEVEVDDLLDAAQDEPAAAEGADAAQGDENAAASESGIDDLLEVAQDGGAGAEQESTADAEPKEEKDPFDSGTDALAAFAETEIESEIGDLLKGLEEVSAEELLTVLQEIRAMLPQVEESQTEEGQEEA